MADFSLIFQQGDNIHDFMFAFFYIDPLLKRGLLQKERICSFFRVDIFSEDSKGNFDSCLLWKYIPFLNMLTCWRKSAF